MLRAADPPQILSSPQAALPESPPAAPEPGNMQQIAARIAKARSFESLSLVVTYISVFQYPVLALVLHLIDTPMPRTSLQINIALDILATCFFIFELTIWIAAYGWKYLLSAPAVINLLAIGVVGAELGIGQLGIGNPRVLRIVRTVRAVSRFGLIQKTRTSESVLGGQARVRLAQTDAWFALLFMGLISTMGGFTTGNYQHWWDAARDIAIYVGFILTIMWKSWANGRHIDDVFLNRLSDANHLVSQRMREIPGLEHAEQVLEDQANQHAKLGREYNEIVAMVDAVSIIISNLRRFISQRTFLEAKGEKVIPADEPVALMFTDIEGFSQVAESMGPRIIPALRHYFGAISQGVTRARGDIDKFIGDAVFAYFYDAEEPANSANNAFDCALYLHALGAMLNSLTEWEGIFAGNGDWQQYRNFRTRVGLHWGAVVAGPIGSDERADSTLIGDSVNVAARMESLCKRYGVYCLVTESFFNHLGPGRQSQCRRIDRVTVPGRDHTPLNIYTIDAKAPPDVFRAHHVLALDEYLAGNWHEAYAGFNRAQKSLQQAGFQPDAATTALMHRITETNSYWKQAVGHLARRLPGVITERVVRAMHNRLSKERLKPPDTWQGYWTHTK